MALLSDNPVRHFIAISTLLLLTGCKIHVEVQGDGAGLVTSLPAGIYCGNSESLCDITMTEDSYRLTAKAVTGSAFMGWMGLCNDIATSNDTTTSSCTASSPGTVIARFKKIDAKVDLACDTDAAKARCLTPTQTKEYYIDQSIKYFRTMESSVNPFVIPNYSQQVARWEWPPWLLLTGYGRFNMIWTDIALKLNPTTYAALDCRAFDTQPFGRCHVVFDYGGELCPIYEEFTFNDQGEITFIEAWTDHPDWIPMAAEDYWAEGEGVQRLANRVPGLGNTNGLIDLNADWMTNNTREDADLAEFVKRAKQPYATWLKELIDHANDVAGGCHPEGTLHR
ncbi:hypothetical protein A9Q99_07835 [Gammaproteobacteria bacterium 45_16_T64]|nr:hypothetical protein A9Q99_07835 [Gammaproteobacteria bacterium 45_16_T64]